MNHKPYLDSMNTALDGELSSIRRRELANIVRPHFRNMTGRDHPSGRAPIGGGRSEDPADRGPIHSIATRPAVATRSPREA